MRPFPARWLATLALLGILIPAGMPGRADGGRPLKPATGRDGGRAGFTRIPADTLGIDFVNSLPDDQAARFQNLMNGCGLAAGDINHDGLPDLYLCHRTGTNALYLNLGDGRFTNITTRAGVGCAGMSSSGALFADLDGDGHLDLFVTAFGGPNALFLGDGQGGFREATAEAGLTERLGATSAAAGDVDGDGDLDLYVCHFGTTSPLRDGAQLSERLVNGVPTVTGRWARKVRIINGRYVEFGEPDTLYLNDGTGRFQPAPWESTFSDADGRPMQPPWDFGLAVQIRDINADGHPDIYVCNDFQTPDRLWIGDGRGHFRPPEPFALRAMSYASMGVDFSDIDRDGHLDFVTVEMLSANHAHHLRTSSPMEPLMRVPGVGPEAEDVPRNCLFHARGDGTWEEIACLAGVAATDWSWTPLFLDVDLDGWDDLLVSNGHRHDVNDRDVNALNRDRRQGAMRGSPALLSRYPPLTTPKRAFRNRRDLTFTDVGAEWGFDSEEIAHGMIALDLEGDGDLDVVMNCLDGAPLVYRNDSPAPRLTVSLRGSGPNTHAIGARVQLQSPDGIQRREVLAGGQYLSGGDTVQSFAAVPGPLTVSIRWPDGRVTPPVPVDPGRHHDFQWPARAENDGTGAPTRPSSPSEPAPWFTDRTSGLGHSHAEDPGDDFVGDPLAPRRYGQLGPGLAVADFNADGNEDVIIGAAAGHRVAWLAGDGTGQFRDAAPGDAPVPADTSGLLWVAPPSGTPMLVVHLADRPADETFLGLRPGRPPMPLVPQSGVEWTPTPHGPVTGADTDGDGTVEYFLGGWTRPGTGPEASYSLLWHLEGDRWVPAGECEVSGGGNSRFLSATWADLDADGHPELITAGEWGDLVIASPGRADRPARRLGRRGWWHGIAVLDADGDGLPDIVAGNWGRNSLWNVWGDGKPGAFHGDLDGSGVVLTVEAWRPEAGTEWRPWRSWETLRAAWPSAEGRFPTHAAYARADIPKILGPARDQVTRTELDTLDTTLFLNRGGRFDPVPLPREAQTSPVFGIASADFDGNGTDDLVLGQNCFAVRPEDPRLAAGLGLLMAGDGRGGFQPVTPGRSGLRIHGEQRGVAVGDFNGDGHPDVVVTQNGAETRLLTGRPGGSARRRIGIRGPAGNPMAWGALVRVRSGAGPVMAKAISGGTGWWTSGNSAFSIPRRDGPAEIEVVWPGGAVTRHAVGDDAGPLVIAPGQGGQDSGPR